MNQPTSPTDIVFEDEQSFPATTPVTDSPQLIHWVISLSGGYVKNEKQAALVLVGFAVVAIGISVLLLAPDNRSKQKPPTGVLEQMPIYR